MSDDNPHKFFTAGEVAELVKAHGVDGFPITKSGMIKWIKRNWSGESMETGSRTRQGQKGGGGTEYHWAWFPNALIPVLDAEVERRNALAPYMPPEPTKSVRERHRRYREASKQQPDLSAPHGQWALSLAAAAGLDGNALAFRPFLVRKVSRCIVEYGTEKYFSRDLADYNEKLVCITGAPIVSHLLWVLEYHISNYSRPAPGQLICIADNRAGKAPYVSAEFQQKAEAKRAAGHQRRKLVR